MECGGGREKAEKRDALAEGEEMQLLGGGSGGLSEQGLEASGNGDGEEGADTVSDDEGFIGWLGLMAGEDVARHRVYAFGYGGEFVGVPAVDERVGPEEPVEAEDGAEGKGCAGAGEGEQSCQDGGVHEGKFWQGFGAREA